MKKFLLGTAAVAAAAAGAFTAAPASAAVIVSTPTQCSSSPGAIVGLPSPPAIGGCVITYGAGANTFVYDTNVNVMATGNFGSSPVITAPFTDVYTFGAGFGTLNISLSTSNSGAPDGLMDIDFTLFRLDGPNGLYQQVTSGFIERTEPSEIFVDVQAGQYYLTISGVPGTTPPGEPYPQDGDPVVRQTSYAGTITFNPGAVPEPATWAMMLAGFGAVGYSLRRKKSYRLQQAV